VSLTHYKIPEYSEELIHINDILSWKGGKTAAANFMGISPSQLSQYLKGSVVPGADKFHELQRFCLLCRKEQMKWHKDKTS